MNQSSTLAKRGLEDCVSPNIVHFQGQTGNLLDSICVFHDFKRVEGSVLENPE